LALAHEKDFEAAAQRIGRHHDQQRSERIRSLVIKDRVDECVLKMGVKWA
jgi:hypothetical protein